MAEADYITDQDVAKLRDMVAARRLLKKLGLTTKNINSVDEAKETLRSHIHRDRTGGLRRPELGIENGIVARIVKEDQRKRDILQKILNDLKRLLRKYPAFRMSDLKRAFPQLDKNLDRIESKLQREECAVLVAGETSAGKSTFLNLLLGETERDLLPVAHLSCSSVITELKYGVRRYALAHPWPDDERGETRELDLSGDDAVEALSEVIYHKGKRKTRFRYKRVEIFWPCDWLKTGVTIVDSPGVGESAHMTQLVKEYMPKAVGFIYIVNSTNAGGIQPDRLQDLLFSQVLEARISEDEDWPLDPNSVIFICNKWDQIPEKEKEEVKQCTEERLKECWPLFKKSQIFQLSAKDAREALQHGFETEEYKCVMEGLGRLLPAGLSLRLNRHYWYISQVLQKAQNNLKTVMSQIELGEDERVTILDQGLRQLHKIESRPEQVQEELKFKIKTEVETGIIKIKEHFTSGITISRVCEWREAECPVSSDLKELGDLMSQYANDRIRQDINLWEKENRIFQTIQDNVLIFLQDKFMSVKADLDMIEHHFSSGSFMLGGDMYKTGVPGGANAGRKIIDEGTPLWAPLGAVVNLFTKPALGLKKAIKKRKKKKVPTATLR